MQRIKIKNQKLGKGISALLGNNVGADIVQNASGNFRELVKSITIDKIIAGIYQPRSFFDQEKLENLSKSIAANGVIQPIIVRRADDRQDLFEIIAGERRYRASKMAGLKEIPVIIKDVSNSKALEFAIIENIQRDDLSAIEEAKGYEQLLSEFDYTQEKVANKLGKSRSYVANIVRLLKLPTDVQNLIKEGQISASHARSLVGKENALELAQEIIDKNLSVRDVEELNENPQQDQPEAGDLLVDESDLEQKNLKKQYLKTLENSFSKIAGDLKVKANYDLKKRKGKVTIFYNDFEDIEKLVNILEK